MDQIALKNFRCFREEQKARLAPLTLLIGENSTGKTSFLAMLRALWDVAYRHRVPDFKEEPYDLGSFDEIIHSRRGTGSRAGTFGGGLVSTSRGPDGRAEEVRRFEVAFGKQGTIPVPVRRLLANDDKKVWTEMCLGQGGSWELKFGTPKGQWKINEPTDVGFPSISGSYMVPFFFLADLVQDAVQAEGRGSRRRIGLTGLQGSEEPDASDVELIERLCHFEMRFFDESLYASAPVRSKPRRTYDPSSPSRDPEGDFVPMYLANLYGQDKENWKSLKNALEKFGESAGLFNELAVTPLGKTSSGPFQIQIRRFGRKVKGLHRNLIDVGYGVSQVLPIITELLRDDVAPAILLQQPEVHLHPSAQAALGTLFCEVAHRNRRVIVETHSDHLLDRVRMDIRDRKTMLKPEDVSILYFERGDLDVHIHSLRLDEQGNVLDQPPGYRQFFMEEVNRLIGF